MRPRSSRSRFGDGRLLNYDTAYSLLWGSELAGGHVPNTEVAFAPTQHPLATAFGALLTLPGLGDAPHGEAAMAIWEGLGLALLGTLGWLVDRGRQGVVRRRRRARRRRDRADA